MCGPGCGRFTFGHPLRAVSGTQACLSRAPPSAPHRATPCSETAYDPRCAVAWIKTSPEFACAEFSGVASCPPSRLAWLHARAKCEVRRVSDHERLSSIPVGYWSFCVVFLMRVYRGQRHSGAGMGSTSNAQSARVAIWAQRGNEILRLHRRVSRPGRFAGIAFVEPARETYPSRTSELCLVLLGESGLACPLFARRPRLRAHDGIARSLLRMLANALRRRITNSATLRVSVPGRMRLNAGMECAHPCPDLQVTGAGTGIVTIVDLFRIISIARTSVWAPIVTRTFRRGHTFVTFLVVRVGAGAAGIAQYPTQPVAGCLWPSRLNAPDRCI